MWIVAKYKPSELSILKESFYKIIGGLGLFAVILEAKLKIHKIKNDTIEKISTTIQNKEEFKKYNVTSPVLKKRKDFLYNYQQLILHEKN